MGRPGSQTNAPPPGSAAAISTDPGVQYWRIRHAFGLDISDGSLKAVECARTQHGVVVVAHSSLDLSAGVVERSAVRQPEVLRDAIRTLLQNAVPRSIATKDVVLSLDESVVYLHPFTFPKALTESQVRRAVPYEAEGELPITLREMYTDILFHRSREREHHVLFAAARRNVVDAYVEVLISAGLRPVVIGIESLALARALVPPQDEPVLIADLGKLSTTITTVERGMVHGAVSIPVSGTGVTASLARAAKLPIEDAESLKRTEGLATTLPTRRDALIAALAPLVAEAQKAASYHQVHTGRPVQRLVLSGGGALLPGLPEYLSEVVGIRTEPGDPIAMHALTFSPRYRPGQRKVFLADRLRFSTGIGLALRGVLPDLVTMELNVLPPRLKDRYVRWWEHALVAALSLCVALGSVGIALVFGMWVLRLVVDRGDLQDRVDSVRATVNRPDVRTLIRTAAEANAEVTVLKKFDDQRVDIGGLIRSLLAATPPAIALDLIASDAPRTPGQPLTLQLQGTAATREAYLEYERVLRNRPDVRELQAPLSNLDRPADFRFTLTLHILSPTSSPTPRPLPEAGRP